MFDNVLVLSDCVHCTLLIEKKVVGEPLKPSKFSKKSLLKGLTGTLFSCTLFPR